MIFSRTISSDSGDENIFTIPAAPGSNAQVDHMLNIMDTAFNDGNTILLPFLTVHFDFSQNMYLSCVIYTLLICD